MANPLQYSCLDNSKDRSLVGYSPWGHRVRHDLHPPSPTPGSMGRMSGSHSIVGGASPRSLGRNESFHLTNLKPPQRDPWRHTPKRPLPATAICPPPPPKQLSTSRNLGRILADAGKPHTYYSRCLSPRLGTLLSSYCVLTPLLETGMLCGSLRPFLPCEHTCLSCWFGASQPLIFFG